MGQEITGQKKEATYSVQGICLNSSHPFLFFFGHRESLYIQAHPKCIIYSIDQNGLELL